MVFCPRYSVAAASPARTSTAARRAHSRGGATLASPARTREVLGGPMYASRYLPLTLSKTFNLGSGTFSHYDHVRNDAQFYTFCAGKLSVQILGWSKGDAAIKTARFNIRRAMPKSLRGPQCGGFCHSDCDARSPTLLFCMTSREARRLLLLHAAPGDHAPHGLSV
jgi:hypothetical protein